MNATTRDEPPSAATLASAAAQFRALGDEARLRLLHLLFAGEGTVQDLAARAGLGNANASKHLAVLAAAGFLHRRKAGVRVVYALADAAPRELCEVMCRRVHDQAEQRLRAVRGGARALVPSRRSGTR